MIAHFVKAAGDSGGYEVFSKLAKTPVQAPHLDGEILHFAVVFFPVFPHVAHFAVVFFPAPFAFFPHFLYYAVVLFLSSVVFFSIRHDCSPNLFKGDASGVAGFRRRRRGGAF
jgi:hypothetical protein